MDHGLCALVHKMSRPIHLHLHLSDAFIHSDFIDGSYTHSHTDSSSQPGKAIASSSGAVRVRCLAQRHLNTQLGVSVAPVQCLLHGCSDTFKTTLSQQLIGDPLRPCAC